MHLKEKHDYRLALDHSTNNLLIVLQNSLTRIKGKKPSIKSILLYFFSKGLSQNLDRKSEAIQKYYKNSLELSKVGLDLDEAASSLDKLSSEEEEYLQGLSEKNKLLQLDLIDQFNLLRNKELRLLKHEEDLKIRELASKDDSNKILKLNYENLALQYKIDSLELDLKYQERETEMYKNEKEKLQNLFADNHSKSQSSIKDIQSTLKKVLTHTTQLVNSDNSLFNKLSPLIAGAAAFAGVKVANSDKSIVDYVKDLFKKSDGKELG